MRNYPFRVALKCHFQCRPKRVIFFILSSKIIPVHFFHILVKNGRMLVIQRSKCLNFWLGIQIWDKIGPFLHSLFTFVMFCRFWIPQRVPQSPWFLVVTWVVSQRISARTLWSILDHYRIYSPVEASWERTLLQHYIYFQSIFRVKFKLPVSGGIKMSIL